mmetsp:Transcript_13294/g.33211  ORF Transcript_13294/g.33211 Transcript_13294/m.33211 type:complete len:269 (-) Transcript_13294:1635-2441(-)
MVGVQNPAGVRGQVLLHVDLGLGLHRVARGAGGLHPLAAPVVCGDIVSGLRLQLHTSVDATVTRQIPGLAGEHLQLLRPPVHDLAAIYPAHATRLLARGRLAGRVPLNPGLISARHVPGRPGQPPALEHVLRGGGSKHRSQDLHSIQHVVQHQHSWTAIPEHRADVATPHLRSATEQRTKPWVVLQAGLHDCFVVLAQKYPSPGELIKCTTLTGKCRIDPHRLVCRAVGAIHRRGQHQAALQRNRNFHRRQEQAEIIAKGLTAGVVVH